MTSRALGLAIVPALLALACSGSTRSETQAVAPDCSSLSAATVDDCLRLNHLQVLGTHNSYHLAPEPALLSRLGDRGRNADYTHRPLREQLDMGIRQFELDVFADPDGGRYATPAADRLVTGLQPPDASLGQPGFKVLHVQDIDYRTTCTTLVACLVQLRDWSRAHQAHVPIMVLIEAKDGAPRDPEGIGFVQPLPIGPREFRALDAEIRSVFDDDHLLTPDDVRRDHPSLPAAIQAEGWPRLRDARGKVLFALDNTEAHRLHYLEGAPALEGRVMFVSSPPGEPSSAFLKLNDALGAAAADIRARVEEGYLVRTRADVPTHEARSGDTTRRDAAFASGAQYVSTDYPETSPFGSGYIARLPGAEMMPARCNPVTAPATCRHDWLEPAQIRSSDTRRSATAAPADRGARRAPRRSRHGLSTLESPSRARSRRRRDRHSG
jgi:hypothetical protein